MKDAMWIVLIAVFVSLIITTPMWTVRQINKINERLDSLEGREVVGAIDVQGNIFTVERK